MLQPSYPILSLQRRLYAWIERQAIRRCHTAVFTTHNAMANYCQRFPDVSPTKFRVIENGYDDEAFGTDGPVAAPPARGRRLTLLHSGVPVSYTHLRAHET